MKLLIAILAFILVGCSAIKETSTTSTEAVTIPAVIIHDTLMVAVPYALEIQNGIDIDSAKRDYFVKNCKGTVNIDQDGLKATISYLSKDNKGKAETITQLGYEIEKKEQEIQATKTVTQTQSTPAMWWIWWHSLLFQGLALILGLVVGSVGLFFLQSSRKIFLP